MTSSATNAPATHGNHLEHPKYRPDIDGLRAIAVISVVLFHAFPSKFRGGFVGVDVFFVISGFLISSIIIGSLKQGKFNFFEFYSRRVNRIFPALLTVLVAAWAFSWFALFAGEFAQLGKHIAGGASFVSNFILLGETGYFDSSAETKILLHLWSLGIEEQFYLIWPIILWAAWRLRINLALTIALVIAASFSLNIYEVSSSAIKAFYSPQTRFWELLVGAALAYFCNARSVDGPRKHQKVLSIVSVVSILLILLSVKFISKNYMFPGWWAAIPVLATAMVIYTGPAAWINRNILSSKPMVLIGLISFPLYLWHWPLLVFARILNGGEPTLEIRLAMVAIAVILAWATYRLIEMQLRRARNKTAQTYALAACMLAAGMVGLATLKSGGFPSRENIKLANAATAELSGPLWKFQKNEICTSRYGVPPGVESYLWYFCYATKNEAPNIVLIGNSYANHVLPGLAENENTKHNSILSIGACGQELPMDDSSPVGNSPCSGKRIEDQQKMINSAVKSLTGPRLVIIGGIDRKASDKSINELSRKISEYEQQGVKIVIFKPHVLMTYNIASCYSRPLVPAANDCKINQSLIDEYESDFSHLVGRIKSEHPSVMFFDTNKVFCTEGGCSYLLNGLPLIRDEFSHMSEFGSLELSKLFVEWAKTNAPEILAP